VEDVFFQYGAIGACAVYLAYDRQVLLRSLENSIRGNTAALQAIRETMLSINEKMK
jgi:hypothetical protein